MDTSALETFTRTTASDLAIKVLAAIAFWVIGRWLIGRVIAVLQAGIYWQVYFDTNEAIVRVCKEAGWPAPTKTTITKLIQMPA